MLLLAFNKIFDTYNLNDIKIERNVISVAQKMTSNFFRSQQDGYLEKQNHR